jgi:sulfotransferase family protein
MHQDSTTKATETWPNFFIVGAARSGTTSLYEYLSRVPQVYMPSIKEPHYFAPSVPTNSHISPFVIHDKENYLQLFRDVKEEIAIGEASPSYLLERESPKLIHDLLPTARIIMILRDPVDRAFSHYLMNIHNGWENIPFYDALQKDYNRQDKGYFISHLYVETGLYSEQVKRYFRIFNKEQIKVLIFEEFIKNTAAAVTDVLRFLNVEPSFIPNNLNIAYNSHSYLTQRWRERIIKSLFNSKANAILRRGIKSLVSDSIWNAVKVNILPIRDRLTENQIAKKDDKPQIQENARIFLQDIYRTDVVKLRSLLGRPLPWSNFLE